MAQWREIVGFPGYEVSDHGDVRRGSIVKKQMHERKGYRWVSLWTSGKSRTCYIAPMVAAAFIGPKPPGQQVRHKDGDKSNNHFSNLEYGTRSENERDKRRHGTAPIGENHPASKLTQQQVLAIRARYVCGHPEHGCRAIAKDYGVTYHAVYRAARGVTWRHLL